MNGVEYLMVGYGRVREGEMVALDNEGEVTVQFGRVGVDRL